MTRLTFVVVFGSDFTTHLDGVVQGRARRVQRQVLERLDLRRRPAAFLRPVDGQHVVGELLSEHQRGGVGLGSACRAALDADVGGLRRRRRTAGGGRRGGGGRGQDESRAGDGYRK